MFLAGGLNRVYEFGEYFRNGSISKMHSSPYLAIEIYATDIDYKSMIEFAKEIYIDVLNSLNEKLQYNFSANLKVISFEMFMSQNEYKDFSINNLNEYFKFKNYNFSNDNYENINNLYKIFKENIMPRFQGAYLITDLPAGISPLIDSLNNNENILKRSLLFLNGYTIMEIAYCSNDYSVIKNGIEKQLAYLERREKNCKKGGVMFEGYAHALKLGILPMSYISISVERFIALLCNNKFITENMIDI